MNQISVKDIYGKIINKIKNYPSHETKSIISKYLLLKFDVSPTDILLNRNIIFPENFDDVLLNDIKKINEGYPIQYITGSEFFLDLKFYINNNVLIPRPETEELVTHVIEREKSNKIKKVLDIGTGSGCIAISIKKNINSEVHAIDISDEAIKVAKENSLNLGQEVRFYNQSLETYNPIEKFDVIISNPPYIHKDELSSIDKNVLDYEPSIALFVERDPVYFYKKIKYFACKHLKKGGKIYFEINPLYTEDLFELYSNYELEIINDIYGKKRFLIINDKLG
ncbi:MAG: peptide chain release factor N(5)-glutamine methyltransferase [Bacteroidota bacterium]|nr:peptide chain release factor N(5)-glutamine methyltransferase [Bacteroidota bacterium]